MHAEYPAALARHDRRLRDAWDAAQEAPADRSCWEELADAARAIEADSVLRGEYLFAYLATKLDGVVSLMLDGPWPPSEQRREEVRDLVLLFHVPRLAWERRQQAERVGADA